MLEIAGKHVGVKWGYLVFPALCLVLIWVIAFPRIERFFQLRAAEHGAETLALATAGLSEALDRFEHLPGLVGEREAIKRLLLEPENRRLRQVVNEDLSRTADRLGASDLYLMDVSGLTLAASSYLKEKSFVGRNFAFRPYFIEAMAGEIGRYHALGTTSGERGYFFAAPVRSDGRTIGVLALKFLVGQFEAAWQTGRSYIMVSDASSIVFMASRPEWHFRSLRALNQAAFQEIGQTQQYPLDQIAPLQLDRSAISDRLELWKIGTGDAVEEFITETTWLERAGWTVSVLVPAGPARLQTFAVLFMAMLLIFVAGMIFAMFAQRRAQLQERFETQKMTQQRLEARVLERTNALALTNEKLKSQVEERQAAEDRLRQTQQELIQAGKLAALGQMSAALSHEINQPLSALKSYADNAAAFMARDRIADAGENVARISRLVDRIANISANLRNFARRPQETVKPVELRRVIDDALELMEVRFRERGSELLYDRPKSEVWVLGGHLRLQQVVVNLLSNALDAMESLDTPKVEITLCEQAEEVVTLSVCDSGIGLDEHAIGQIFDPFFTTKSPGRGLGLGLSISFNIVGDFGGRIYARNRPSCGAEFTVELPKAIPAAKTNTDTASQVPA